ncbi:LysR family transcriptional regulator [Ancylobacter polymorphus]|uniref:DNA-binding transcriptional LysR family regulator n=1 Tax=Ancylobacter polymorphus TaxID=223390 RepID=A0ABU0B9F8_9HYPH|nr:LysR family transcriptional regulator [Ancylobacter polymorphus]MDQ0302463.1 DNA-binding transcriptional LysR family regulator [Ancylobacter polymorphus]
MKVQPDITAIAQRLDPFLMKHWRFILAAAEEGSFRRAADRLGVQQSTLSRRIRDIEDAIGATLFARSHAGVRPTFAGRRLLGPAREILAQASQAALAVERAGTAQDGVLRIGLPPITSGAGLTQLLRRVLHVCPNIRVELFDTDPASQCQAVRRHELDVTLQVGCPAVTSHAELDLWDEPVLIVMAERDVLATSPMIDLDELAGRHFIFMAGDPALPVFRDLFAHVPTVCLSVEPLTRETNLLQLVALGQGLTLTTVSLSSHAAVTCRPLTGQGLPLRAVWSRSNPNPALTRFLSVARELRKSPSHRCAAQT